MPKPYVTVLIDTYNHERFIERAIASVLDQDFPSEKMEILVVDDGSTDQTPEIVRKFEPRVRLIRKANGGQASAFNVSIPEAQGEIVSFLDGDDWWAPLKLKEVMNAFDQNPDLGVVGHGYHEVHPDASKNKQVVPQRTCRVTLKDVADARSFNTAGDLFGTSKLAVRKEVLARILPIPEGLVFMADAFIFYFAIFAGGAMVLESPLCYYRVHPESLFVNKDPGRLRRKLEMQKRLIDSLLHPPPGIDAPRDVLFVLAEPWALDTERSFLALEGGNPWRTFQVERTARRLAYAQSSLGYKAFQALSLGLALVMPPRRFYQLKKWYASRGLRRYREKLGTVVPAENVQMRREKMSSQV